MSVCFLDTSTVVHLVDQSSDAAYAVAAFDDFLVSQVVLGELIFGCHRSRDPEYELRRVREWVLDDAVVTGNAETAGIYGKLAADLETRGLRIPQNDLWIASLCLQTGFPLLSTDRHFSRVPGLTLINYHA